MSLYFISTKSQFHPESQGVGTGDGEGTQDAPCRVLEVLSVEGSVPCMGAELSKEMGAPPHCITDPPAVSLVGIYTHHNTLSPSYSSPALFQQKLSGQPWGDKSSSLWTSSNSDHQAARSNRSQTPGCGGTGFQHCHVPACRQSPPHIVSPHPSPRMLQLVRIPNEHQKLDLQNLVNIMHLSGGVEEAE